MGAKMFYILLLINLSFGQEPKFVLERVRSEKTKRRTPVVRAIEKASPCVVSITTETISNNLFGRFYGSKNSSDGSGVVISKQGIVLTNAHVVEQATTIQATFADGRSFDADIVGIATDLDLAVLRLKSRSRFSPIKIGYSSDLMLGERVIAIGNPFGLGHTVTTGIVSALSRPLETERRIYQDFIQTDAGINPGNSGGPLINLSGELVGINTAIRADAEGIGFAIPIDRAAKVAQDLLNYGDVQIPWLGLDLSDVIFRSKRTAAQITYVHPKTTAEVVGLKRSDIILKVDERDIRGLGDLNTYLAGLSIQDTLKIQIWRQGQEQTIRLKPQYLTSVVLKGMFKRAMGIELDPKDPTRISKIYPRGSFAQKQLMAGDRIIAINGSVVRGKEDIERLLLRAKSEHRDTALFSIRRRNARGRLELGI